MDLDKLKSTWKKVSDKDASDHVLSEESIGELLRQKSKGVIQRFDKNIRIGFFLMFLLICISVFGSMFDFPLLTEIDPELKIPFTLQILDLTCDITIITIFLIFYFKYKKIRLNEIPAKSMSEAIQSLLKIIKAFKKQFYVWLVFLFVNSTIAFMSGFQDGLATPSPEWYVYLAGFFALAILLLFMYYIYRWIFNRLFGRYYDNFKNILSELNLSVDKE